MVLARPARCGAAPAIRCHHRRPTLRLNSTCQDAAGQGLLESAAASTRRRPWRGLTGRRRRPVPVPLPSATTRRGETRGTAWRRGTAARCLGVDVNAFGCGVMQ
jgi:hypothetical protein